MFKSVARTHKSENKRKQKGAEACTSSRVIACGIDVYSALAVIFNILCLEVAYDSVRLFYFYWHYIYDHILSPFTVSVSVPVFLC